MPSTATQSFDFRPVHAPLSAPQPRLGVAVRTVVRALQAMQKEALVASSESGCVWRLVSDEGPYLAGSDLAPPPLGVFVTGLVSANANALLALASERGIRLANLRLTQDTFYSMEGSALRGTMTGGARSPSLHVEAACDLTDAELGSLAVDAVATSPPAGLIAGVHESLFALIHNGARTATGRVGELVADAPEDPQRLFEAMRVQREPDEPLMHRAAEVEPTEGEGGVMSSLRPEQSRTLHARAVCTIRPDGTKQIDQYLFKPRGSQFRMLSDERGRAPDALSYLAAGIALCFMTQLGRYASITRQKLDRYRALQDMHLSGNGGPAAPIETHVFLDTPGDADAARKMLDMGEQTCFLHALCRTPLEQEVTARSAAGSPRSLSTDGEDSQSPGSPASIAAGGPR
ncbi:MAG TPA: OsmC family protein [Solirubrobacteraceae bacterium]|nr:OsmC family protein [Solirubrobacteraceae bacterium]